MKMASEDEIKKIESDFRHYKAMGNSILKAAYLATSDAGFVDIIKSAKNTLLLKRPEDGIFLCLTTKNVVKPIEPESEQIANFHTDLKIFN